MRCLKKNSKKINSTGREGGAPSSREQKGEIRASLLRDLAHRLEFAALPSRPYNNPDYSKNITYHPTKISKDLVYMKTPHDEDITHLKKTPEP